MSVTRLGVTNTSALKQFKSPRIGRGTTGSSKIPLKNIAQITTPTDDRKNDLKTTKPSYSGTISNDTVFDQENRDPSTELQRCAAKSNQDRPTTNIFSNLPMKPPSASKKISTNKVAASPLNNIFSTADIKTKRGDLTEDVTSNLAAKEVKKSSLALCDFVQNFSHDLHRQENEVKETSAKKGEMKTVGTIRHRFFYKELQNPKNHCYLNSVLQVICSRPLFASRVLQAYNTIVEDSKSNLTEIFKILSDICQQLPISPSLAMKLGIEESYDVKHLNTLISYLGQYYCEQFLENDGQNQQDAQEFYGCLIDALDDQCEGKRPKKQLEKFSGAQNHVSDRMNYGFYPKEVDVTSAALQGAGDNSVNPSVVKYGCRSYHAANNNSTSNNKKLEKRKSTGALILPPDTNPARLFRIPLIYTRSCNDCQNPTSVTDQSNLLSISLDSDEEGYLKFDDEIPSIQFLLDGFFAEERIEVTCGKCAGKTATNKVLVDSAPIYLMILVMRYSHATGYPERLGHVLNIDEKLSLEAYMKGLNERNRLSSGRQEPEIIQIDETIELDEFSQRAEAAFTPRTQASDDLFDDSLPTENNTDIGECDHSAEEFWQDNVASQPWTKKAKRNAFIDDYCNWSNDFLRNRWLKRTRSLTDQQNTIMSSGLYTFRPPPNLFAHSMQGAFDLDRHWEEDPAVPGALKPFTKDDLITRNHPIKSDGNCLFRALSWWITGSEIEHDKIRVLICAFLRTYPKQYSALLKEDVKFEDHVNEMSLDGTWGTQVELLAAAELFSITIFTLHYDSWKIFRPRFYWNSKNLDRTVKLWGYTQHALYLSNPNGCHFDVVLDVMPRLNRNSAYDLVGVVNHSGHTLLAGHYTALVKQLIDNSSSRKKETWLLCDDARISEFGNLKEALKSSEAMTKAYLLLYRRRDVTTEMEKRDLMHILNEKSIK